jgi:tetratricopeptide (TPR) repeat protein
MMRHLKTDHGLRTADHGLRAGALLFALALSAFSAPESNSPPALLAFKQPRKDTPPPAEPAPPVTPHDFYNAGTRQLAAGKLREAESSLETALASQQERLQSPTLYNLGLVRFDEGLEQLKKGPESKPSVDRGRAATEQGDAALHQVQEALVSNDVEKMVAAYIRGRGARKELRGAIDAVQRALKVHGAVLSRWERASGDFKSALELKKTDADARQNADIVDRCIAKLVDSLQEMQQCSNGMCNKKQQLGEAMKKLKGRIPGQDAPPGAAGEDDDEEDEQPLGPQLGQEEGASKEGQEMHLTPEQAEWLLDAYRLDTERRLPMGPQSQGQPRDRSRPTW